MTTIASATEGSVTDTRFNLSVVLMRRDLPTITRSGAAPGDTAWLDVEVVAVEDCASAGLAGGVAGVSWGEAAAGGDCGLPPGASVRANIVVAPRSKTAATSVRAFMNSNLCEDARANPSKAEPSRK